MKTLRSSKQVASTRRSVFDDRGEVWDRCLEGQGVLVGIITQFGSLWYCWIVLDHFVSMNVL